MDLVSFQIMFRMFWLTLINPSGSDVDALKQLVIPEKNLAALKESARYWQELGVSKSRV